MSVDLGRRLGSVTMRVGVLVLMVLSLGSCFEMEGELKGDGSGQFEYLYPLDRAIPVKVEKSRFTCPTVVLDSIERKDENALAKLSFKDITKLSACRAFAYTTVKRKRREGVETLDIIMRNPLPVPEAAHVKKGMMNPRIKFTLPGRVLKVNEPGKMSGNEVEWKFDVLDFFRKKSISLQVIYEVPEEKDEKASEKKATDKKDSDGKDDKNGDDKNGKEDEKEKKGQGSGKGSDTNPS